MVRFGVVTETYHLSSAHNPSFMLQRQLGLKVRDFLEIPPLSISVMFFLALSDSDSLRLHM